MQSSPSIKSTYRTCSGVIAALFFVGGFWGTVATATVTVEFAMGELENVPVGAIGILVADRDVDGFTSPADPGATYTLLQSGQRIRNSDDVILAVVQADNSAAWAGNTGFADTLTSLNYEALGVEAGDPLIFYWFPTVLTDGASLEPGVEFQSFRTDSVGASGGTIGFIAPADGGSYRLSHLSVALGGDIDPSNLSASGTTESGSTPGNSDGTIDRDLMIPADLPLEPGETIAAYDSLQAGSYFGLLRKDAVSAGEADITGYVSGKITHHKKTGIGSASLSVIYERIKYRVKGSINAGGDFTAGFIKRDLAKTPMTVTAQLVDTSSGRKLIGTITGDGNTSRIDAFQRVYHSRRNPAPQAGALTMALPFDEAADHVLQPGGDGIGYGTMSGSGTMRTTFLLGDGTKTTTVVYLGSDGEMMFYRTLYKRDANGWIGGTLAFRDVENISQADGLLHWKKGDYDREALYPLGFNLEQKIIAVPFSRPNARAGDRLLSELPEGDGNAILNIVGGNTAAVAGKWLTWDNRNRIKPETLVTLEPLALKASTKNGLVSGRYRNKTTGQDIKFVGVAIQNQGLVVGNFKGDGQTGAIVIDSGGHPALLVERVVNAAGILDGDTLDFGSVGVDGGMTETGIRVRNPGTGTLVLTQVPELNQSGTGFILSAESSGPIRPGGEKIIRVQFDPELEAAETGSLTIRSNDETSNPFTINLTGTGVAGNAGEGAEDTNSSHVDAPANSLTQIDTAPTNYDSATDPGNYSGIVFWNRTKNDPAGLLAAKISHSTKTGIGGVSGSISANGASLKFKGPLLPDGSFDGTLSGRNSADYIFNMTTEETVSGDQALTGTLQNTQNGDSFSFVAMRSGWHSKAAPSTFNGSFTVLLPALGQLGDGYPGGDGAGTLRSSTAGTVKIAAYLADNTRLVWSGRVDDSGRIQVFKALDRLKPTPSVISGNLTFRDLAGVSDLDGKIFWRRSPNNRAATFPQGFELRQDVIGSAYIAPAKGVFAISSLTAGPNNAGLSLTGASINETFSLEWTDLNRLRYTPAETERIANKLATKNGSLSGSWFDRGNTNLKLNYRGVVFQKQNIVSGYWYFYQGQTGLMQIRPAP